MPTQYLDAFFHPQSVAVFGASDREGAVGHQVFANLAAGEYSGRIYPINPKREEVQGHTAYPDLASLGTTVDLVVIATPAATVPEIIRQCGEHGVHAAIVLSAGFGETGGDGERLMEEALHHARRHDVRIVGPNCLGIIRPEIGMNATFTHLQAMPGNLALVSQSGALCTAILDWAHANRVGFSAMVSVGDAEDVDFGDLLDYLATDPKTRAILLYIEGIQDARSFVSGLRAAARMKPVIVVKAGRHAAGSNAAMSHTGSLVGADDVFDSALSRAGAVRAMTIEQLFSAAHVLSSGYRVKGNRLALVTNAGGPGVLAADRAADLDVELPAPGEATMGRLDDKLPGFWSRGNPVDILGDAPPERYRDTVGTLLADRGFDGVLAVLTPQAMTRPTEAADALVEAAGHSKKPLLACWMGEEEVREGRDRLSEHGVPNFQTPETAVEAFGYLASFYHNQQMLMQVPSPLLDEGRSDPEGARLIVESALDEGRNGLSSMEAKAVLTAFNIPVERTAEAHSATEALVVAESLGFPVAMKINSPDVTHKSDVGGIRLNIGSAQAVRTAYREMVEQVQEAVPEARIEGVTIEHMYQNPNTRELMVGVIRDPVFGPVISFGAGGTAVEILQDRAVTLPPLNRFLAQRLIGQTRVARLLGEFRNMPPVNCQALEHLLVRVSEMVCELPHIQEMDINPLIADDQGVMAVDVRFRIAFPPASPNRYAHMAIHPYPADLAETQQLPDGTNMVIRPIRPEDAEMEQRFVHDLSEQSKYFRFMQALRELTPQMLVRFTQIDYDREMAFVAVRTEGGKEREELGVARYSSKPDGESCEFALVVADDWHHKGIGTRLMQALMEAAKTQGLEVMEGEVLSNNHDMLSLVRHLGFSTHTSPDDDEIQIARREL